MHTPWESQTAHTKHPISLTFCLRRAEHLSWWTSITRNLRYCKSFIVHYAFSMALDRRSSHLPIPRSDFTKSFIEPIYQGSELGLARAIHPHKLSVMFIVLASGALCDNPAFASTLAHQYYVLSRAALSLRPLAQEANIATVQAIFMHIWFIFTTKLNSGSEERWVLKGICVKVAQIVNLYHNQDIVTTNTIC